MQVLYQYFDIKSFAYNRELLKKEWYVLLTPSLVHFNWMHWFLNILNLFALLIIFKGAFSPKKFIIFFILASTFITICLYIFNKNVYSYIGMSGVLYAMAIYGSLYCFNKRKAYSVVILIYLFFKLTAGETVNEIMFVDVLLQGMKILRVAHYYGAIFGLLVFCCIKIDAFLKR